MPLSNIFSSGRFMFTVMGIIVLALAGRLEANQQVVVSEAPPLPSRTEAMLEAAVLPAWARYELGEPKIAAASALADFVLLTGILDLSQSRERFASGLRGILIGALIVEHLASVSYAFGYESSLPHPEAPRMMETGRAKGLEAFFAFGYYQNAAGIGLAYAFEHLRLSLAAGGGLEKPTYGLPDTGSWTQGERMETAPIFSFGLEGRWRINPLLRLQPGIHILFGTLTKEAWVDTALGIGSQTVSSRESQGMWIIPGLEVGLDPLRAISIGLGAGWEALRPGAARSFQASFATHGHEDLILPRLRFNAQVELFL
jgi:hypothetical protein